MNNYSVLMSVYYKENPQYLYGAMMSIFEQSVKTNDFVLICDGNLTPELDEIIDKMQYKFQDALHVHRLKKNGGLGNALNIGIKLCKNELIARMDSDDISMKDRCERELNVFKNNPSVSIVSGIVEEFNGDIKNVTSRRVVPENAEEIIRFAKKRNPFNHPCVMYKKSAVEAAGGYKDFYLLEDYYLWIRMLDCGFKGYNIQDSILWMRSGSEMYKRRGGWKYAKSQIALFKYMRDKHFITNGMFIYQATIRTLSSIAPNAIRKFVFEKNLRK